MVEEEEDIAKFKNFTLSSSNQSNQSSDANQSTTTTNE